MNNSYEVKLDDVLNSDNPGAESLRLGYHYINCNDFYSAKKEIETAYTIHKDTLPTTHPVIAEELTLLGIIYWNLEEILVSHRCFFEALEIDKQNYKHNHQRVIRNINNLGLINKSQGRMDQAVWLFDRALISSLPDNPNRSDFLANLSLALFAEDRYHEAIKHMDKAVKIDTTSENELKVARNLMYLGFIQKDRESPDKITGLLKQALEIFEKNNKPYKVASCLTYIGDALTKETDKKLIYYIKALQIFRDLFSENHPDVKLLTKRMTEL